jgi:hypothetical protein
MKFLISLDELQAAIQHAYNAGKTSGLLPKVTSVSARSVQLVLSETQTVDVTTPVWVYFWCKHCRKYPDKKEGGDHTHRRCSTAKYLDAVDATFGGTNQQHRRSAARRGLPFASDATIGKHASESS